MCQMSSLLISGFEKQHVSMFVYLVPLYYVYLGYKVARMTLKNRGFVGVEGDILLHRAVKIRVRYSYIVRSVFAASSMHVFCLTS